MNKELEYKDLNDPKIVYRTDGSRNRVTDITYKTDAGQTCYTRLAGHVPRQIAFRSIMAFRASDAKVHAGDL